MTGINAGIVRTCLEYGEDTAVIIVLTANGEVSNGMANGREMHKDLAAYYGLPVIDFLSGLTVVWMQVLSISVIFRLIIAIL